MRPESTPPPQPPAEYTALLAAIAATLLSDEVAVSIFEDRTVVARAGQSELERPSGLIVPVTLLLSSIEFSPDGGRPAVEAFDLYVSDQHGLDLQSRFPVQPKDTYNADDVVKFSRCTRLIKRARFSRVLTEVLQARLDFRGGILYPPDKA